MLFVAPSALGYAGEEMAARMAWFSGIIIFVLALATIVKFASGKNG